MVTFVLLLGIQCQYLNTRSDISQKPFFFFFSIWHATLLSLCAALSTRKSYEFEDLLQSSTESCRVDWYAQSRLGLTRTLSEENVYEDIIGKQNIKFIYLTFFSSFSLRCVVVSECYIVKYVCYKLIRKNFFYRYVLHHKLYVVFTYIKLCEPLRFFFVISACHSVQ